MKHRAQLCTRYKLEGAARRTGQGAVCFAPLSALQYPMTGDMATIIGCARLALLLSQPLFSRACCRRSVSALPLEILPPLTTNP
jgi:hypothetical protein